MLNSDQAHIVFEVILWLNKGFEIAGNAGVLIWGKEAAPPAIARFLQCWYGRSNQIASTVFPPGC